MDNIKADAGKQGQTDQATNVAKRPWAPPAIEQVDFTAVEAAFFGVGTDAGLYS